MRMLDATTGQPIDRIQLYLTVTDAKRFRDYLDDLLSDPEAVRHWHLEPEDQSRDLSFSIVTQRKLRDAQYTADERALLEAK